MKAIDAIRLSLKLADDDLSIIEDMRDAPLTQPTSRGGNHPLWILGHLTVAEGRKHHILFGEPVLDFASVPSKPSR